MRIEGSIYGENNKPISAVVTVIDTTDNTAKALSILPGERYFIDGDESAIRSFIVVFSANGYKSISTTGAELIDHGTTIELQKNNTAALLLITAGLAFVLFNKKKKVGKLTTADLLPFLLIAGSVLAVNAIQKILDKLGLGGDPSAPAQADPNSPWKPTYWQKFSSYTYAITDSTAKNYAETIHDAFTLFQDDFNAILGVFSQMRTKANVSFLSYVFTREYNQDLLAFLGNGGGILPWDGLSKTNMQTILSMVDKLPTN